MLGCQTELDPTSVSRRQNSFVECGKSPSGGERFLACDASSRPRCFNIFSIPSGSSMLAMIFTLPPHLSHLSISMAKTRFNLCAPNRTVRHRVGFVLTRLHDLFRFILQLSWHDMRSQLAPRGENPMKPREVHPRLWDQSRQTPDKLHGAEDGV